MVVLILLKGAWVQDSLKDIDVAGMAASTASEGTIYITVRVISAQPVHLHITILARRCQYQFQSHLMICRASYTL